MRTRKARSLASTARTQPATQLANERLPRADVSQVRDSLRAIGIIQAQNGRLGKRVAGAKPRVAGLPGGLGLLGCSGLPSILVGRPSWLSTNSPKASSPRGMAVAKNRGLPGTRRSGART